MDFFYLDKLIINFFIRLYSDSFLQLEIATIALMVVELLFPEKKKEQNK